MKEYMHEKTRLMAVIAQNGACIRPLSHERHKKWLKKMFVGKNRADGELT